MNGRSEHGISVLPPDHVCTFMSSYARFISLYARRTSSSLLAPTAAAAATAGAGNTVGVRNACTVAAVAGTPDNDADDAD